MSPTQDAACQAAAEINRLVRDEHGAWMDGSDVIQALGLWLQAHGQDDRNPADRDGCHEDCTWPAGPHHDLCLLGPETCPRCGGPRAQGAEPWCDQKHRHGVPVRARPQENQYGEPAGMLCEHRSRGGSVCLLDRGHTGDADPEKQLHSDLTLLWDAAGRLCNRDGSRA